MAGLMNSPTTYSIPLSIFVDNPLSLAPDDYPNVAWSEQHSHYDQMWSYYKGYILNKKQGNIELYPVKLNIVRTAVINHAAVLLGQFSDDQIVQFSIRNNPAIAKEQAAKVTRATNMLWQINNGDNSLLEQAILQQVFGGCFWQVAWNPTRRKWPIRFFTLDPRACFPVWDGNDYDRLVSMDVFYQVPRPTAVVRYRVDLSGATGFASDYPAQPDYVTIHEHWDETEYFIKVDQLIGKWPDGSPMQGDNPFFDPVFMHNVVPYVYVPRIRAGDFFGESAVSGLTGPQNELNNNLAHLTEGLQDAMHPQPFVKDRQKGVSGLDKPRDQFIDLGMTSPGGRMSPEVGRMPAAELNDPMIDLVTDDLVALAREYNSMPSVAYGRTDASIRSALTLKYMMWPSINVGQHYRKHNSHGFKRLMYLAFVIAHSKRQISANLNGVGSLGIDAVTPDMIETQLLGHKTHWPPMLPDDRAELVNEMVQRIEANIISPETAIRRLDGSDELEEEMNRIDEHRKKVAEAAQKTFEQQAAVKQQQNPPGDRTNRAQAEGGRAKNDGGD